MSQEDAMSEQEPVEQAEESQEDRSEELPSWARDAIAKANKEAAGYRAKLRELEPLASRAREMEESQKSEAEKVAERLQSAEQRAQEAELRALRLEVAAEKGLTPAQARRLVGSSREELESDADDLLVTFQPKGEAEADRPATARRPVAKLKPGAAPAAEPEETDPRKLALAARARGAF